jgi:hypothetical protein
VRRLENFFALSVVSAELVQSMDGIRARTSARSRAVVSMMFDTMGLGQFDGKAPGQDLLELTPAGSTHLLGALLPLLLG